MWVRLRAWIFIVWQMRSSSGSLLCANRTVATRRDTRMCNISFSLCLSLHLFHTRLTSIYVSIIAFPFTLVDPVDFDLSVLNSVKCVLARRYVRNTNFVLPRTDWRIYCYWELLECLNHFVSVFFGNRTKIACWKHVESPLPISCYGNRDRCSFMFLPNQPCRISVFCVARPRPFYFVIPFFLFLLILWILQSHSAATAYNLCTILLFSLLHRMSFGVSSERFLSIHFHFYWAELQFRWLNVRTPLIVRLFTDRLALTAFDRNMLAEQKWFMCHRLMNVWCVTEHMISIQFHRRNSFWLRLFRSFIDFFLERERELQTFVKDFFVIRSMIQPTI